jgi:pyruvate formate lyase activating enzyme
MKEALYYKKLSDGTIQCLLCPHYCYLNNGETGKCKGRINHEGILFAENYGKTIAHSLDPMEKKPLYHFYPGSNILSLGANSCNFSCDFCQNYQSSQEKSNTREISPESLLAHCKSTNCKFVAFTYTEPTTWFEFVLDSTKLLKKNNIKTVLVTNGYINPEPLNELLPYIDAMNIDLKSINDIFYQKYCCGSVKPVLETIRTAAKHCHVELTNLLITDANDGEADIRELVDFVASVNTDIPLHLSRYYPCYKMTNPPTTVENLENAKGIAKEKLNHVYLGNVLTDRDTFCPNCKTNIIKRRSGAVNKIENNACPNCGYKIYGKF